MVRRRVVLPTPGRRPVDVPDAGFGHVPGTGIGIGLPAGLGGKGVRSLQLELLDPKTAGAGLGRGLLAFTLDRDDGGVGAAAASLEIDYSAYSQAFGADFAGRLQLWRYDRCVLTTPKAPGCSTPSVIDTKNDPVAGVLTVADVPVDDRSPVASSGFPAPLVGDSGGVIALGSTPTSVTGSLTATDLRSAARWSGGSQSGDFGWSYPIDTPPATVGPTPKLSLNYSSQSVDGYTADENSQPGTIGLGWELGGLGYIERQYRPCSEEGHAGWGDLCWPANAGRNATISLNGTASRLIYRGTVPAGASTWSVTTWRTILAGW